MKKYQQKIIIPILISIGVFILDFTTKYFIKTNKIIFKSNFLAITQHYNHGSIGNLPLPIVIIISISIIALIFLTHLLIKEIKSQNKLELYALNILIGGALGNLVDRILHNYVFDWILILNISIINIADIAISLGALWYLYLKIKKDT